MNKLATDFLFDEATFIGEKTATVSKIDDCDWDCGACDCTSDCSTGDCFCDCDCNTND